MLSFAAIGWAAGAVLGLVDGLVGRSLALVPTLSPLAWGVGIDGVVGLVAGLLLGFTWSGTPRRAGLAVLVGLLATGVGVWLGRPQPRARVGADVPRVEGPVTSALWITIDGLSASDLDRMPFTKAWAAGALQLPNVAAWSPDRRETLEAVLAARLPPGRVDGAPRAADAFSAYGLVPLAVVQGDSSADRAALDGFAAVASAVREPGLRAAGTGLARLLAPSAPTPSDSVRAARSLLGRVPGRHVFLAVELPAAAPREQLDDAVRVLIDLVAERRGERDPVVLISGLTGRPGDAPDEPTSPAVRAPAWLGVTTGSGLEPGAIVEQLGSVDLMPTLLQQVNPRELRAFDGGAVDVRAVQGIRRVRIQGEGRRFSGDPVSCGTLHLPTREVGALSVAPSGARTYRLWGWAVVQPPSGAPRLYDEVVDPFWVHDLVALGAPTCEGVPAADRAKDLLARADAVLKLSADHAGRIFEATVWPYGPPRELYPDPLDGIRE